LGHMRSQGCRDLLVYCNSGRCNYSTIMNVGHLPDDTRIKSLGDGFVCAKCGHLGADAVPIWPIHAAPRSTSSSARCSALTTDQPPQLIDPQNDHVHGSLENGPYKRCGCTEGHQPEPRRPQSADRTHRAGCSCASALVVNAIVSDG